LLLNRFDWDRSHTCIAVRCVDGVGVIAIGLVANPVLRHKLRRHQFGLITLRLQPARPIVRAPAALYDYQAAFGVRLSEERREPAARQSAPLQALAVRTKAMHLELVLGQIHAIHRTCRNRIVGDNIHGGLVFSTDG
jgi:hypothetical protein